MPLSVLRRARPWLLLLAVLAGLCTGAAALPLALAQSPVTLQVRAGYDGSYRLGEWFPVVVDVANDGPDLRAELEWSLPGRFDEQVFRRAVDLPRGSRKRVVLDAYSAVYSPNGRVRLLDGATELASQDVSIDAVDDSIFLIGVVSSDPALLNALDTVQINGFSGARVRHIAVSDLPETVGALRGLDALFFHDIDSAVLAPAQREALAIWVSLGGQLVVGGGANAAAAAGGLADLLPVQSVGALAQGDIAPLATLAGADAASLPAGTTLSRAQPRPDAELLPPGASLLFRHGYGAGLVTFSAFDLASLRGWPGEPALWGQVLRDLQPLRPGASSRLSQFNLLDRGVLKLPSLNLPSPWTLLLFVLGYVLVIGPLNYVVLRRVRRLELAWITVPVVVLLFTGGLYIVGTLLRGGTAQYNQLAIVESSEGQRRGLATSFIGLFSPQRASYALTFPQATLVTGGPTQLFLNARFEPVRVDEAGAPSVAVLADIASVTMFVAEATVDVPPQVESNLAGEAQGMRGEIRNSGAVALDDAVLVRGNTFVRLGTLAPGVSKEVRPEDAQANFPSALDLGASGVFDRQPMMNMLFDRDLSRLGSPGSPNAPNAPEGIYLLGWVSQPAVATNVDGQPVPQNGLTLYVLRLRDQPGR